MKRLGILSLDHPHAGGNHLPALKYIQQTMKVAAICHREQAAAQSWLDLFGAKYVSTPEELLHSPDIDAVLVTSINSKHAEDCVMAARAGKDIFCDKPIAISMDQARAVLEAVRRYSVRYITTFPLRFNTSLRALKAAIAAGKLGNIVALMATNHGCMYEVETPDSVPFWVQNPKENGGGCVIDHTVHVADIMRWITGAEFAAVKLEAGNYLHPDTSGEDIAVLHGTMTDGTIFQIDCSWSRRARHPMWGDVTWRVVGTKGSASLDLYNNQKLELFANDGNIAGHYPFYLIREHGEIFLDYISHVEQGTPLRAADALDGVRTVELVAAAYESLAAGTTVAVNKV